jgi:putative Ca2+/H+ antiporter (TMEM165/GDT1 family)
MAASWEAFALALGAVFLAELGDKSQLLLMAQASRHPPLRVLAEAVLAFAFLTVLAVTVGALIANVVPALVLEALAGALFLAFGAFAVREAASLQEAEEDPVGSLRHGGTLALVVVSEMGDKTQLATAALAASGGHVLATGLGAFAALALSSALAVAAGGWLAGRLEPRRRAAISAILFLALGLATLGHAVWVTLSG